MNNQHTIYFCQDGLEIELPQGFKFDSHIHNQFFFREPISKVLALSC